MDSLGILRRHSRTPSWPTLLLVIQLFFVTVLVAEDGDRSPFARFHRTGRSEATLDTSVCLYRHPETLRTVGLVAAVHIAEGPYYQALQDELDRFDLVLFERIGTREERESELWARYAMFGELQHEMAKLLELRHQADEVSYDRKTFRHADLTLSEFHRHLEERGDDGVPSERLTRLLGPLVKLGVALARSMGTLDPHQTNRLCWQIARILMEDPRILEVGELEDGNDAGVDDVIIGVRNDHAWRVFQEALPENHQRIAIFYGAAHLPDFDRRLRATGWERVEVRWIPAWQIPVRAGDDMPARPRRVREARL